MEDDPNVGESGADLGDEMTREITLTADERFRLIRLLERAEAEANDHLMTVSVWDEAAEVSARAEITKIQALTQKLRGQTMGESFGI